MYNLLASFNSKVNDFWTSCTLDIAVGDMEPESQPAEADKSVLLEGLAVTAAGRSQTGLSTRLRLLWAPPWLGRPTGGEKMKPARLRIDEINAMKIVNITQNRITV